MRAFIFTAPFLGKVIGAAFSTALISGVAVAQLRPTTVSCNSGHGYGTPSDPTGPTAGGDGGPTELQSIAPNNLTERCVWSAFVTTSTITTAPMTFVLGISGGTEGSGGVAQVTVTFTGFSQTFYPDNSSGGSITIPAGIDLQSVTVTAMARAAYEGGCATDPEGGECFYSEAVVDVGDLEIDS